MTFRCLLLASILLVTNLFLTSLALLADGTVDLTQDPKIQATATYSYFARGDGHASDASPNGDIRPFKTLFYPQESKDEDATWNCGYGSDSNAHPITFTDGLLTNRRTARSVAGWQNINELSSAIENTDLQSGSFDIVFDLGMECNIAEVVVSYSDAGGHRWITDTGAQSVYLSTKRPERDSDLTLFAQSTCQEDASKAEMKFTGQKPAKARYVIFRPMVKVTKSSENSTAESVGGYISNVAIHGNR